MTPTTRVAALTNAMANATAMATALLLGACGGATPDTGFLVIDTDRIFYQERGSGLPIVIIGGGSGQDVSLWNAVADDLARDYRVISVDPRGVGRSANPDAPYSDRDDLALLLDDLAIDEAIVAGLSSSGEVALEFAAVYPERARALVAVAPFLTGFEFDASMQARLARFNAAAADGREAFLDAMLADPHFLPAPLDTAVRDAARERMAAAYDRSAGIDHSLRQPLRPPLDRQLGSIRSPTLLLAGELDHPEFFRRNSYLVTRIGGARQAIVRDAGHTTPLENARGTALAIRRFIAEVLAAEKSAAEAASDAAELPQ